MIASVSMRNFAAHELRVIEFNPNHRGVTRLIGPSEEGKSTTLTAICWVLFDCDTEGQSVGSEWIREGQDRADVSVTLASGTVIRKTITQGGSRQRQITVNGETFRGLSAVALADQLGAIGEQAGAIRLAMCPGAWRRLTLDKAARPLRDMIIGLLPPADLRGTVASMMEEAGHELLTGDSLDAAAVAEQVTEANRAKTWAAGRLDSAHEQLNAVKGRAECPVSEDDAGASRDVRALDSAWDGHDSAVEYADEANGECLHAINDAQEWDVRRGAIPRSPSKDEIQAAESRHGDLDAERERLHDLAHEAGEEVLASRSRLDEVETEEDPEQAAALAAVEDAETTLHALPADDTCQDCKRPGHPKHAARLSAAQAALQDAVAKYDYASETSDKRRRKALGESKQRIVDAFDSNRIAQAAVKVQITLVEEAAAPLARLRDQQARNRAQIAKLGDRPRVPDAVEFPAPPADDRPTRERSAWAQSILEQLDAAGAITANRARDVEDAEIAVDEACTAYEGAEDEAQRLGCLVKVLRAAPQALSDHYDRALGDLGPVSLVWGSGHREHAVRLLLDGRTWNYHAPGLASTGRKLVGDLWFRAAIRRALGLWYVPLWVEQVQDVQGQPLPDVGGPVVLLETADVDGMEVRYG